MRRVKSLHLPRAFLPERTISLLSAHSPTSLKERTFTEEQESTREDVERQFGVLEARLEILERAQVQVE